MAAAAQRSPDPSRGGSRVVLEGGLTVYSGLVIDYSGTRSSAGGLPGISAGLLLRYFAAEVEAVNVDIEGEFTVRYVRPMPNDGDGSWLLGTAGLALGLTPHSTPINFALGPWLGFVSYDIDRSSAKGTDLAVGGSGAVRLLFGSNRNLSLGAALTLGLLPARGGYTDIRILFGYGF